MEPWTALDVATVTSKDIFTVPRVIWAAIAACHCIGLPGDEQAKASDIGASPGRPQTAGKAGDTSYPLDKSGYRDGSVLDNPHWIMKLIDTVTANPIIPSNISAIARLVNPDVNCHWTGKGRELQEALTSLLELDKKELSNIVAAGQDIKIGYCQPGVKLVHPLAAYRICRDLDVPLTHDTDLAEMETALLIWLQVPLVMNQYIMMACSLINSRGSRPLWRNGLVSVVHHAHNLGMPNYEELERINHILREQDYKHRPTDIAGLICWTAHHYMTNPMRDRYPLLAIIRLIANSNVSQRELMHIVDDRLPLIYSHDQLEIMARAMGLDCKADMATVDIFNTIVNHSLMENTFYPGAVHPAIGNHDCQVKHTAIRSFTLPNSGKLGSAVRRSRARRTVTAGEDKSPAGGSASDSHGDDELADINQVIVYGTAGTVKYALTFGEMADVLASNHNYNNFLECGTKGRGPTNFSRQAIARLRYLVAENTQVPDAIRVGQIMAEIDLRNSQEFKQWASLRDDYFAADKTVHAGVAKVLMKLERAAMFMRSWTGKGPYPIEAAPQGPDDEVNARVNVALSELEETIIEVDTLRPPATGDTSITSKDSEEHKTKEPGVPEPASLGPVSETAAKTSSDSSEAKTAAKPTADQELAKPAWGTRLMNMPLVTYYRNEFVSPTGSSPRTIRKRIDAVQSGERSRVSDGCIRLSSNLLICTVIRIQQLLKLPPICSLARLKLIQ